MKVAELVQAAIILLLLASAASCEVGKIYFQRTFQTTHQYKTDSGFVKFLPNDTLNNYTEPGKNLIPIKNEPPVLNINTENAEKQTRPKSTSTNGIRSKRKRNDS